MARHRVHFFIRRKGRKKKFFSSNISLAENSLLPLHRNLLAVEF
jgi:hypothetical protein